MYVCVKQRLIVKCILFLILQLHHTVPGLGIPHDRQSENNLPAKGLVKWRNSPSQNEVCCPFLFFYALGDGVFNVMPSSGTDWLVTGAFSPSSPLDHIYYNTSCVWRFLQCLPIVGLSLPVTVLPVYLKCQVICSSFCYHRLLCLILLFGGMCKATMNWDMHYLHNSSCYWLKYMCHLVIS